jgi:hypothetical protein
MTLGASLPRDVSGDRAMVTVNAISKYGDLSVRAVPYYARIGLVKLWRHPDNKHRILKASNVDRVRFILTAILTPKAFVGLLILPTKRYAP